MTIHTIKTDQINPNTQSLIDVLEAHIKHVDEYSVIAITSKIVAITEGNVVNAADMTKNQLIEREADYFLPAELSEFNLYLTVKDNVLIPNAGIDESNGNGYYILWPHDAQGVANTVRKYLCNRFNRKYIGVIITDSKTTPLRRGTTGVAIAHSGFKALNDYVGKPDIYGKELRMTKANISEGLAATAVLMMGEGNEQTPLAIIDDVPFVSFLDRDPTTEELGMLTISLKDDLYAPILSKVDWKQGGIPIK